ncbi:M24 family metallopeptidase [Virgibacillus kimchii]
MTNRIDQLLKKMKDDNVDSIFITSPANFYYVSNHLTDPHERLIGIYISQSRDPLLIVPALEREDAKSAGWKHEVISYLDHEDPWKLLSNQLRKDNEKPKVIGLEFDHLNLERYHKVKEMLPESAVTDIQEILASVRVIKSPDEYARLKQAAELADFGIETGIKSIEEGVSELEIIANIEYELKKQGIQQMSFQTMTLSGAKTASPHGTPTMKKIETGDMVLFDLGVVFEGYCSDITRTVAYKSITEDQRNIYETVLAAEKKAIEAAQIGTAVGKLDQTARDHIESAGYGEYFTHRIGHGLGIETHEYPSMHGNNTLALEAGMSFTIEPGIYVPGKGGVRIEDMVFMTEKGPEQLTKYPKELQIIEG